MQTDVRMCSEDDLQGPLLRIWALFSKGYKTLLKVTLRFTVSDWSVCCLA